MSTVERVRWVVNAKGSRGSDSWEIAVVREDNAHGIGSYGWFNDTKLLVSHNGGHCHWPILGWVWDQHIAIAEQLCEKLNAGVSFEELNK